VIKPIVVVDTNIFISATFWEGQPYAVVKKALNQEIVVFISQDIINEIKRVLVRDFSLSTKEINKIIDSFILFTHLVKPKEKINVVIEDPSDNRIIECAITCNAKHIITQDKHLLKLKEFKGIKIITPKDFLDLIK
jgi:putative PIN family toxin of toxin-antitoxin system